MSQHASAARRLATVFALTGALLVAAPAAHGQGTIVEVQTATSTALSDEVATIGSISSNESVVVKPEIAGIVVKIAFDEGASVKQGQLLVSLEDSVYRAEMQQAEAELQLARRTHERAADLFERKVGTAQTRDETLARLESATAAFALAKAKFSKTQIHAPFSGFLGLRQVSIGTYVTPGQPVVNLEDIDLVKIDFNLAERHLGALRAGQSVDIQVDPYPDRTFSGKIYAIDPHLDVNGRSIAVRARVENAEHLLRPGLFARVVVSIDVKPSAIMIPEEAIMPRGADRFVYRVVDDKAMLTKVRTGLRRDGKVEIVEGLSDADVVVTAGHQKLRDGAAVTAVPAGTNPGG